MEKVENDFSAKEQKIETNLITLTRHVLHEQTKLEDVHGDLTLLLVSIQTGCKFVSSQVRRAGIAHLYYIFTNYSNLFL